MQTIRSIHKLHSALGASGSKKKKVGFVPTMGALHEGHLSLIRKCRKENDIVVVSIFVNPAQFGPKEDYKRYPRNIDEDRKLCRKENVDILFTPSVEGMYPEGFGTNIHVEKLSEILCGASRPGHFDGVTTVVGKLLNIVSPDILYLGQKDFQQAVIVKQMIRDMNFPVRVKVCPTVREPDGLALSSRNKYLTRKERREAPVVYRTLKQGAQKIKAGERNASKLLYSLRQLIRRHTSAKIDYMACVDTDTLKAKKTIKGKILIAVAVKFSRARLIDNVLLNT